MGRQTLVGCVAGVGVVAAVGLWFGFGSRQALADGVGRDGPMVAAAPVGRYQSTHLDNSSLWVTDTATGHVWVVSTQSQWTDCGSPSGK